MVVLTRGAVAAPPKWPQQGTDRRTSAPVALRRAKTAAALVRPEAAMPLPTSAARGGRLAEAVQQATAGAAEARGVAVLLSEPSRASAARACPQREAAPRRSFPRRRAAQPDRSALDRSSSNRHHPRDRG